MTSSERLAVAAQVHILLRRKMDRVTDTEWMTVNHQYALEIVRLVRNASIEHPELAAWVEKLEQATAELAPKAVSPSDAGAAHAGMAAADEAKYRGRLR